MVDRGVFYTDNTNIIFHKVSINWDLGFDKAAKHGYIDRIRKGLPPELLPTIDVTSGSDSSIGRTMSPIFLKTADGTSVEDLWSSEVGVPGVIDYIYCTALSAAQRGVIAHHVSFMDVFHKVENGKNTQAFCCALFRLLLVTDKLYLLNDPQMFVDWYNEVPFFIV